ncbi:hypothetical protein [Vibrio cholerae]|uniref:hypothetical protein n=1 Tax=Vibrio cholerae TaxID=666 RepID=UPI0026501F25|nr:hypothetical protein [Vibrio cholerae]MDN6978601.1 hypothetical protein [Vibrio cholerae]
MSKEIHKVDYKAQPKVNREWWEILKKESEREGTNAAVLMRVGAELIRSSLNSGVIPECSIEIRPNGHVVITPTGRGEQ